MSQVWLKQGDDSGDVSSDVSSDVLGEEKEMRLISPIFGFPWRR